MLQHRRKHVVIATTIASELNHEYFISTFVVMLKRVLTWMTAPVRDSWFHFQVSMFSTTKCFALLQLHLFEFVDFRHSTEGFFCTLNLPFTLGPRPDLCSAQLRQVVGWCICIYLNHTWIRSFDVSTTSNALWLLYFQITALYSKWQLTYSRMWVCSTLLQRWAKCGLHLPQDCQV